MKTLVSTIISNHLDPLTPPLYTIDRKGIMVTNTSTGGEEGEGGGDGLLFPGLCEKSRVVKRSLCRVSRARSTGSEACTEQIRD